MRLRNLLNYIFYQGTPTELVVLSLLLALMAATLAITLKVHGTIDLGTDMLVRP